MELNVVTVEETEHVVIKTDVAIQTIEEDEEDKEEKVEKVEKSSWKPKFHIPAIYLDAVWREFRKSDSSQTTKATQTKEFFREPCESRGS